MWKPSLAYSNRGLSCSWGVLWLYICQLKSFQAVSPVQTCLTSLAGQWKQVVGGVFLPWSERTHLSSTCISAFSERCHFESPSHLPVSSFLWFCSPTVWRLQCLRPHPTCIYFSWKPSYQGGLGTTPSVLEFARSTELRCRSAPVGSHVLNVCKEMLRTVERCLGSVFWSSWLSPLLMSSASVPSLPPL